MSTWRGWVAWVPDPVLGARSAGARSRLFVAAVAVVLSVGDAFVIGPLLPGVMGSVRVAPDRPALGLTVLSVFAIGLWTTMGLADRLLDVFGLRRQMVCALLVWTVGAVIAANARGPAPLCAGRALQGAAGGLLIPTTLAMVRIWWPADRGGPPRVLITGAVVAATVLGSWVATTLRLWSSWRLVFRVEALIGAALAGLLVHFDDPRERHNRARLDPMVVALGWLGLAVGFLLAVHHGRRSRLYRTLWDPLPGTSPMVLLLVAIVAVAAWRDLRGPRELRRVLAVGDFRDRGGLRVMAAVAERGVAGGLLVAGCGALRSPAEGWRGLWPWLCLAGGVSILLAGSRRRVGGSRGAAGFVAAVSAGAALGALIVYLPLFNLATRNPHVAGSGAWVDLRVTAAFAVSVLVGVSLLGCGAWVVAGGGFLCAVVGLVVMSQWGPATLRGHGCWPPLLAVGVGLGLVAAPARVLRGGSAAIVPGLGATLPDWFLGLAVGVPLLTARGAAVFRDRMHGVLPAIDLCPTGPGQCVEYERAVRAAVLDQFRAVFLGAALCAALAATVVVLSALSRFGHSASGHG